MKISKEKIEMIKKFCETHPKIDAAKRFHLSERTISYHTKGINYKPRKNGIGRNKTA